MEAEFQIFGSPGKDEMWKWTYPYLEVLTEQVWKMNEIFRVLAGKRNFRSLAVKQRRSAEAQFHIFESPGRDEMWKRTYPYLEVLTEQVWKTNEIFRSPDQAEVWKAELQIFGSQGRAEVRKRNFTSLEVPAEMKCGSSYLAVLTEQVWKTNEIFRSPDRAEVRKVELHIFGSQGRAEVRKRNFTSLEVPAEMKCGSGLTLIWKSW